MSAHYPPKVVLAISTLTPLADHIQLSACRRTRNQVQLATPMKKSCHRRYPCRACRMRQNEKGRILKLQSLLTMSSPVLAKVTADHVLIAYLNVQSAWYIISHLCYILLHLSGAPALASSPNMGISTLPGHAVLSAIVAPVGHHSKGLTRSFCCRLLQASLFQGLCAGGGGCRRHSACAGCQRPHCHPQHRCGAVCVQSRPRQARGTSPEQDRCANGCARYMHASLPYVAPLYEQQYCIMAECCHHACASDPLSDSISLHLRLAFQALHALSLGHTARLMQSAQNSTSGCVSHVQSKFQDGLVSAGLLGSMTEPLQKDAYHCNVMGMQI